MTNIFTPAQARIPIGSVVINGRQVEVAINIEWAKYFESLTSTTNAISGQIGRNGADGAAVGMLAGDGGGGGVEFIPGPQGIPGERGGIGPALGLMAEATDTPEFVPGPPGAQGLQGPPGPAIFLIQDNETNDIFWPIKAG
jgi:hypothetical protein